MDDSSNGPPQTQSKKLFRKQRVALENLGAHAVDTPDILYQKAIRLLNGIFEAPENRREGRGYAHGGVGLLAQHTSYYDGFAVILGLPHTTAVVIRNVASGPGRVVFDDALLRWAKLSLTSEEEPVFQSEERWRTLVYELLARYLPAGHTVHVSVASMVPPGCMEAFFSSLSVAVVNAIFDFLQAPVPAKMVGPVKDAIEKAIDSEFSKAFIMVSREVTSRSLCIIDTATEELIQFDAPPRDHLGWGLIEVEIGAPRRFNFYHDCGEMGKEALQILTQDQFPEYTSFRDVSHHDLPRVLNALPLRYRSIVRHLVNENKRVQAMIGAIRGVDWQKLGGLLFISHASLSNEWNGTNKVIDYVIGEAQDMSSDGIYGACMTGRGGYVLVVGLPLELPNFMRKIEKELKERFNRTSNSMIL